MKEVSRGRAVELLQNEAQRIRRLIANQKNSLCVAHCKAFEEVVDTQMYGLSRQVAYAIQLGILDSIEGQQILSDLERNLDLLYQEVYKEQHIVEQKDEDMTLR